MQNIAAILSKYLNIILLIAVVVLAIYLFNTCNKVKNQKLEDTTNIINDTAFHQKEFRDENGYLHVQVNTLSMLNYKKQSTIDSLMKLLHIKPQEVKSYSTANMDLDVNAKVSVDTFFKMMPCPLHDSFPAIDAYAFDWHDKDTRAWGVIGGGIDSVHVQAIDTLHKITSSYRNWALGSLHTVSDFSNSNKDIAVITAKDFQTVEKKKNWSVGLDFQLGYPLNQPIQFQKPVVSIGLSLQRPLIRF